MELSMFYCTASTEEEGETLAKILVEKKLAACVNVFSPIRSFFYWEGQAQEEEEVICIGKTRQSLLPALIQTITDHHSYEVPCVVTWSLEHGNPGFLEWIAQATREGGA